MESRSSLPDNVVMASVEEAAVRRYWRDVWTDGDVSGVGAFYAPTFRLNGEATTTEEFAEGVISWRAHFPDFGVSVDQLFSCPGIVVTRVLYRGTHEGDFKNVPATGRSIEVSGIDIFRFREGKVVDHWHEADHLEMFRQLGAEVRPTAPPNS
jgi:steroid delta-isomerase-like uncharacterized protein